MNPTPYLMSLCLVTIMNAASENRPMPTAGSTTPRAVDPLTEVWAREEAYWRFVAAGDVEHYLELWHPDFRGWPCASEHPATKATIGDWVRDIRDQHLMFTYKLQREGGTVVNGAVIVYYRTPMIYRYPDGKVQGESTTKKFTHTWLKTDGVWQIIGGMCGADAPR